MNDSLLEQSHFYKILPMNAFRKTPGVEFHVMTKESIPRIDGVDRVIHKSAAISPGPVGSVARPWYMHPHQDDNLLVLSGERVVDIYKPSIGKIFTFRVTPDEIWLDDACIYSEPAILVWPRGVFHRIISGSNGSASLNLATRYEGFDIRTNFSIYTLDTDTGSYSEIRKGDLDQV
ncbi:MAG: hypothetical protein JEY99_16470 [Spirochaetales bacterium]|nr:hypothetical protein [Spirochaetales bacterium]